MCEKESDIPLKQIMNGFEILTFTFYKMLQPHQMSDLQYMDFFPNCFNIINAFISYSTRKLIITCSVNLRYKSDGATTQFKIMLMKLNCQAKVAYI